MEDDIQEYVLNYQQRYKRGLSLRRHATRISLARERLSHRPADLDHLKHRARKKAIEILKTRLAGPLGASYSTLSTSQKIQIDKRIDKRKGIIARIAQRLLPKIRSADMERLHGTKHVNADDTTKAAVHEDVNNMFESFTNSLDLNERFKNI